MRKSVSITMSVQLRSLDVSLGLRRNKASMYLERVLCMQVTLYCTNFLKQILQTYFYSNNYTTQTVCEEELSIVF